MTKEKLLEVSDLSISFQKKKSDIPIVQGVSFTIHKGEIIGVVGESGCGKSVTSLALMGLNANTRTKGRILFQEKNLLMQSEKEWRHMRGNEIAMIFQEPMTSLNPLFTIGDQLIEALSSHTNRHKKQAAEKAVRMLETVGLPRADQLMKQYPHELSGGMRQRVMIAMALICDPKLLIADEPTTALDVTIQAQILSLLKKMNTAFQTAILLITHDLGVVHNTCRRVMIMYAGRIVEEGSVAAIFADPKHPYTKGLFASIPAFTRKSERLTSIEGQVPKPGTIKKGCMFAPRCPHKVDRCVQEEPQLGRLHDEHAVRCFLYEEEGGTDD
ncbi:ABC transporter ATP-binding protein [Bacillus sonorensis]|uniref:Dipeptide/oligopeptide ABC transporter ATP-binding protein n=2 Tax=Bacillus sonorensis TaxID=119858 RepID=M5PCF2_9BACI|nr:MULTISPECIES: ABC transporter ATP-binding protein [Bacillus]TWK77054.1 Oligopeptide transport ATP-binding protein OppD [Bacillus paralicheniformis]ASB87643.1 Oligopeptide transport ATP-binding protein OppD [Bacillus sonorensis]EME72847.1 dipeptide/oligopeptide ABC transporter ATP-binding protein [Bacillus sonorensis L12]MBG9916410.1 peptide ABC transporter ATP-binding protein [Bacillus sonorensis]MCF7617092.1 ABC transporter ATP-binding protein [Bacillus sonorensis]